MQPANLVFGKDPLPIDIAGSQLRDGAVPPVRHPKGRSQAKAPLKKIDTVTAGFADAVVRQPANQAGRYPAGGNAVFDQLADGIIDESSDNRRTLPETPA